MIPSPTLEKPAAPPPGDGLADLSADGRELREAFDRDAGKVRLVFLLSPT